MPDVEDEPEATPEPAPLPDDDGGGLLVTSARLTASHAAKTTSAALVRLVTSTRAARDALMAPVFVPTCHVNDPPRSDTDPPLETLSNDAEV